MTNITLDQLSNIENCTNNDILLISRKNANDIYVSYTYNLKKMHKHIADDVSYELLNAFNTYTEQLDTKITTHKNDIDKQMLEHKNQCDTEHARLEAKINAISSQLDINLGNHQSNVNTNIGELQQDFTDFSDMLNDDFNTYKSELSEELQTLYNNITSWISNNFVSLAGNQTITGKKTFTQEIDGTAKQAKWA